MRTIFCFFLALTGASSAFAQGKVFFGNDSLHLVFWNPNCDAVGYPGSGTFAGRAYRLGDGGASLSIELWAGTSAASLSRQATTSFSGQTSPGRWQGSSLSLTLPAGTNYFQILIYDNANPPPLGTPIGQSVIFTAVASGGVMYNNLAQHISPAFSTWPNGGYPLDTDVGPGAKGAITLSGGITDPLPSLSIQPAGSGQVTIDWAPFAPLNSTFYLQVNSTLAPAGWTDAPSGNAHPVTAPAAGSIQFYRLIQRCP